MLKRAAGLSVLVVIAVLSFILWRSPGPKVANDVAAGTPIPPSNVAATLNPVRKIANANANGQEPSAKKKADEPAILKEEHRLKRWERIDLVAMLPFDPKNPSQHSSERDRIELQFFGEKISFNRYKEVVNSPNSFTWVGTLDGNEDTLVSFTIEDNVVIGEFNLVERFFSIRNDVKAGNVLMEIDLTKPLAAKPCEPIRSKLSGEHEDARHEADTSESRFAEVMPGLRGLLEKISLGSIANAATIHYIDILVLGRTGVTNVSPLATNYVAYTNAALARSGVNAQLRLKYSGLINQAPYFYPFAPSTPEYKNLIRKYLPDRVVFLQAGCMGGACGMAEFQPKMSFGGFGIFQAWASTTGSATLYFAHEVGHLLGANHQEPYRGEEAAKQSEPFAQAYTSGSYGTIVSQSMANHYPYYSSPAKYGDAKRDNVRAMNLLVEKVSKTLPQYPANKMFNRNAFVGNNMSLAAYSIGDASYMIENGDAMDTGPYVFEWYKGSTLLKRTVLASEKVNGSSVDKLLLPDVQMASAGVYTLKVITPISPPVSGTAELKVLSPPVITVSPNPAVYGGKVTFSAPLFSNFEYGWRRNGVTYASGIEKNVFVNDSAASSGDWQLTVRDRFGTVFADGSYDNAQAVSNVVRVQLGYAPTIAIQPRDKAVAVGSAATLSVAATGTAPLTYQWLKNGTSISGAAGATYSLASVQAIHAGTYSVKVTNPWGTVTSSGGALTVGNPPLITSQPVAKTVATGASAAFSVTATGVAPLSYQWLKNGTAIAGATGATYSLASAQATHAGTYSVRVINPFGSVTSSGAALAIGNLPVITTQPVAKTIAVGGSATFSVVATGSPPLTYQWLKNGSPLSGATTTSLSLSNVQTVHAGTYSVKVTNSYGSVTSSGAVLTLGNPPVITTQPVAQTLVLGTNGTLSVIATGATPLAYVWKKDGLVIPGAASTLNLNNAQSATAGKYSVEVSNSLGKAVSSEVQVKLKLFADPLVSPSILPTAVQDITSSGGL